MIQLIDNQKARALRGFFVNDEARYLQALLGHLNRYKRYPESARRMRREGVVEVTFTVNRQGQVADARVVKSAGFYSDIENTREMTSDGETSRPHPQRNRFSAH